MKLFKCPNCNDKYEQLPDLLSHIEDEHKDSIPKDQSAAQYYYMTKTGKTHGNCVVCKRETKWNDVTGKYHRFCGRPECKEKYREVFKNRMIGTYGKVSLLEDPEHQKKMLANRSISGKYKWSDGKEIIYTGTYELDFLKFLDLFMGFSSDDIIAPSPHTYYYKYNGEKKFYMPDFFIPSLNLEVEIKDGGDNPNMHHKHQAVDKVKEKLKDEVLMSQKDFSYIKVVNKKYDNFINTLIEMKKHLKDNGEYAQIFDLGDSHEPIIRKPVLESYLADHDDDIDEGFVRELVQGIESPNVLKEILEGSTIPYTLTKEIEEQIKFMERDIVGILDEVEGIDNKFNLDCHHAIDSYLEEQKILSRTDPRPGIVAMNTGNIFLHIMESLINGDSFEDIIEGYVNNEYRKVVSDLDGPEMRAVCLRDSKAMSYYLHIAANKLKLDKSDIFKTDKYINDVAMEATYQVEGQKTYPVYVLLTHTGTFLSNAIKMVTKKAYSHASISFDETLEEMYSFGRKYKDNPLIGTFVSENIKSGLYADVSDTASYSLYVTFVTKPQLDSMKKRLARFQEDGVKFKYSFKGLINYRLGKESDSTDAFFCSQFVDHVLSAGKQYFDRHSSLVEPTDFSNNKDFYFVAKGKVGQYDPDKVVKRVEQISKKAKLDNYEKKEKVVYIGLSKESIEQRRLTIIGNGNARLMALPTSLMELENMIYKGEMSSKITHYTVIPMSKLKMSATLAKSKDKVIVNLPLDIKVTNVNKL